MENDLIYVYCILKTAPGQIPDVESLDLKSILVDDFCAVVKDVSADEFAEENLKKNLQDIQWLEANVRDHIRIIGRIMETGTVIPFKFGTIFNTKPGLETFLRDYSASLDENFQLISGKEEWAVKIYYRRKVLVDMIDELSLESAALEKQIMASSPGKAFLLQRKKEVLVNNEIERICKAYGQLHYDEFNKLSESTSLNNLLPKELSGREEAMILNAAFLVCKNKVIDFRSTVDKLRNKDGNPGFIIEVTGPWPPFSFISVKEKENA